MPAPDADPFIAGDWGTSQLRLFLHRPMGEVERLSGPGVAAARGRLPEVLFGLIADWVERHGPLPIVLSGMVGSTVGWREVPYLPCPADPATLALALHRFDSSGHPVALVPGLRCQNPFGAPDLLRGEETQIVGALEATADLRVGRHLLCLPGTHSKWVRLEDGIITDFLTGFSGELFELLRQHGLLATGLDETRAAAPTVDRDAFQFGLERARVAAAAELPHLLFEVRSRSVSGTLPPDASTSFLSGLLVQRDVAGALRAFGESPAGRAAHADIPPNGASRTDGGPKNRTVHLIGTPELNALYGMALELEGVATTFLKGDEAAFKGLQTLHLRSIQGQTHS